jgi:ubiquinone/menaquinone biosynthesis C-methylase UbiE
MNNQEFKERERQNWASVAAGWQRRDAVLTHGAAPVTGKLIELARIASGHHVLDIASGIGEPSLTIARHVGNDGRVVGTDLTDEMLAYARSRADRHGIGNLAYHCVDGETLDFPAACFDAVTCRWGLMFMPEPTACLRLVRSVMKDGGWVAAACWDSPDRNPFVSLLLEVLARHRELPKPPPGTPGIFALADPQRLRDVFETAGLRNLELVSVEIDVIEVADGREYWETMSDLAAPVMGLVNQLDAGTRARYVEDVIATADAMKQGDRLRMRGTTWVIAAQH